MFIRPIKWSQIDIALEQKHLIKLTKIRELKLQLEASLLVKQNPIEEALFLSLVLIKATMIKQLVQWLEQIFIKAN